MDLHFYAKRFNCEPISDANGSVISHNFQIFEIVLQDILLFFQDEALEEFKRLYRERIVPKLDSMFKDIPDVPLL